MSNRSRTEKLSLLGPPPVLKDEDAAGYHKILEQIYSAVEPTDFIEEIWVRDLADVTWSLLRLRRVQAAFLNVKVLDSASETADKEARELAEAEVKIMKGTEKKEMEILLCDDSQERVEQYPRANEKFQEFYETALSNLNMDAIQADVIVYEFDTIERFEHLIAISQRRMDLILREIDRHRVIRGGLQMVGSEKPKMIVKKNNDREV